MNRVFLTDRYAAPQIVLLHNLSMFFVWSGVFFLVLRFLEVGPVAELSWWWAALPFGLAFLWFEVFESMLGFDRRLREGEELEELRRRRIAERFKSVRKDN